LTKIVFYGSVLQAQGLAIWLFFLNYFSQNASLKAKLGNIYHNLPPKCGVEGEYDEKL